MTDLIAYVLAIVFLIGLCLLPFVVIGILIALVIRKAKQKNKPENINPNQYSTGWTWNEQKQLWEPPEKIKTQKNTDFNSNPEPQPRYFHHDDKSFETQQKPITVYTYNQTLHEDTSNHTENSDSNELDFRNAYQSRQLFTRNEWQNYKTLRNIAEVKGYVICPKVRLLDIIEPRKGEKKYKTLFYKIQAKHVDFVICDQDMFIKAIIELDDSSHDRKDRKERDEFVDLILRSVGYKVIHTRYITNDILDLV